MSDDDMYGARYSAYQLIDMILRLHIMSRNYWFTVNESNYADKWRCK